MNIPKYIIETLWGRAEYEWIYCKSSPNYAAGYTFRINEARPYQHAAALKKEVEKLCKWADRQGGPGTSYVLKFPTETHFAAKYAIVTIFDPVMQHIESYIQH